MKIFCIVASESPMEKKKNCIESSWLQEKIGYDEDTLKA